ncbi:hypothetical protein BKA83DRAFT_343491 [Pisolithus microcarpus]|nr:hypothetical protein BKA83DRAFT_343491 [Pisolithus microcarpus]
MASTHESSSCSGGELAIFPDDKSGVGGPMKHNRTGTWAFMSAALVRNPGRMHVFLDDIESFVHVLGWTVLYCLSSPMGVNQRAHIVSLLYDHSFKNETGWEEAGSIKQDKFILGEYPPEEFKVTEHSPILELIRSLASPFYARYNNPPTEQNRKSSERDIAFLLEQQFDKELLDTLMVPRYDLGIERLSSSEWFLNTIQNALEAPGWPDNDRMVRHGRTGTWQFISAALLDNPAGQHQLIDDIESFVHVLGWTVLCFLPSPMDVDDRKHVVSSLYNHSSKSAIGQRKGGNTKQDKFISGDYPSEEFKLTEHSPILELIRSLASPFYARYCNPPTEQNRNTFESIVAFFLEKQFDMKLLDTLPVPRYDLGIERLNSSEWFLNTIQDALKAPGWPDEDVVGDNVLPNAPRPISKYCLHLRGH